MTVILQRSALLPASPLPAPHIIAPPSGVSATPSGRQTFCFYINKSNDFISQRGFYSEKFLKLLEKHFRAR
jgi:hypothetical protein